MGRCKISAGSHIESGFFETALSISSPKLCIRDGIGTETRNTEGDGCEEANSTPIWNVDVSYVLRVVT